MDTAEYLKRIDYRKSTNAALEVLTELQKNHLLHVPFENLDIHYGRPIILDNGRFFEKIVLRKRGGFCYELNGLFHALLIQLGFNAKIISARVHTTDNNYSPEYDHLAVVVTLNGRKYLCDVGFGEFAFMPLEIKPGKIQEDRRGNFVIDDYEEGYYRVSKIEGSAVLPEYIFTLAEKSLHEFEAMCYYHQSSPASHFKQQKLITKPTENGRITLTGSYLKITEGGQLQKEEMLDEAGFKGCLSLYFDIDRNTL
jgi:N-hydroxyarylamine O-acetyltransferase